MGLIRELAVYEGQEEAYMGGPLPFADSTTALRAPQSTDCSRRVWFLVAGTVKAGSSVEDEQGILGMVAFTSIYSVIAGRQLHVDCLVVRESARGKGIGSLLMQEVIRRSAAAGLHKIRWSALCDSKSALQFYKRRLGATVDESGD